MKRILLVLLSVVAMMSSCVSQKELTYLQDKSEDQLDSLGVTPLVREDYLIQVNDILNINIKSFDEKTAKMFNATESNGNIQINDALIYIQGYSIDLNGNIEMPVIGEIHVEGLTLAQAKDAIENEVYKFFKKDAVYLKIQLAGIRYAIVGEVNRPGKYVIYQNQVNIFEAIANAGDISFVGKRDNVQIIRQMPSGVKMFKIDLTDVNVISSPYYFIQPNDVINIQPHQAKSWGIGTNGWGSMISVLTLISSTLAIYLSIEALSK